MVSLYRPMFTLCGQLTEVDVNGLETTAVTTMQKMFNRCSSLEELAVSSLDTSSVTSMKRLFGNCTSLKKWYLSLFNNVTNVENMFLNTDKLSRLILGKDFSCRTGLQFTNGSLWLDQSWASYLFRLV